jgi:hypothetical protein
MRRISKIAAILLIVAGSFSCGENGDMSDIDFSNIDNLYEQPLSVIQKCIRGKWKMYASYGGFVGISYPENTFIEFKDDHFIMDYDDGSRRTVSFQWKKREIQAKTDPHYGEEIFVMCDNAGKGLQFFESIRNETLAVAFYPEPNASRFWGSSLV